MPVDRLPLSAATVARVAFERRHPDHIRPVRTSVSRIRRHMSSATRVLLVSFAGGIPRQAPPRRSLARPRRWLAGKRRRAAGADRDPGQRRGGGTQPAWPIVSGGYGGLTVDVNTRGGKPCMRRQQTRSAPRRITPPPSNAAVSVRSSMSGPESSRLMATDAFSPGPLCSPCNKRRPQRRHAAP